ncbi:hypothetical protein [Rhodoferax sp.]|uniref:hypothetical protein n=1 Tax=Rhodoferax sp. TaxID=50421 RepID=UPI00374C8FC9
MQRLLQLSGLALALMGAGAAWAQGVQPMAFQSISPITRKEVHATTCGIQFVGKALSNGTPQQIEIVDGSLSIFAKGYGMVKAAFKVGVLSDGVAGLRPTELQVSWVRVASSSPITPYPGTQLVPGDSAGYEMFVTSFESTYVAINELIKGKMLWISFSNASGPDRIFSGPVEIDPATRKQFLACVDELASNLPAR